MKIKKSLLAGLAVLALFGAGLSASVSSVDSVEANAATHHKISKKHRRAKKTPKKKTTRRAQKRTIRINNGRKVSNVKYSYMKAKSYKRADLGAHSDSLASAHDMKLKKVTYYKLSGMTSYKTAVTVKVLFTNETPDYDQNFGECNNTYLTTRNGHRLSAAWGNKNYNILKNVSSHTKKTLNLTFYSVAPLSKRSLHNMNLHYSVGSENYNANIRF